MGRYRIEWVQGRSSGERKSAEERGGRRSCTTIAKEKDGYEKVPLLYHKRMGDRKGGTQLRGKKKESTQRRSAFSSGTRFVDEELGSIRYLEETKKGKAEGRGRRSFRARLTRSRGEGIGQTRLNWHYPL